MIRDEYQFIEFGDGYITLTARELEVLKLMAAGKTNPEIGKDLIISSHTAKAHVGHILHKMCAKDRVNAVAIAIRKGIID